MGKRIAASETKWCLIRTIVEELDNSPRERKSRVAGGERAPEEHKGRHYLVLKGVESSI